MNPMRLIIVDDHAIVRQGLRAIIRVTPEMQLVGEAEAGSGRAPASSRWRVAAGCR